MKTSPRLAIGTQKQNNNSTNCREGDLRVYFIKRIVEAWSVLTYFETGHVITEIDHDLRCIIIYGLHPNTYNQRSFCDCQSNRSLQSLRSLAELEELLLLLLLRRCWLIEQLKLRTIHKSTRSTKEVQVEFISSLIWYTIFSGKQCHWIGVV